MAKGSEIAALKAAFPKTIPILAGFLFLGMTYGIYARVSGLPLWFPILMSVTVFAGSMEFVAVGLLLGGSHGLPELIAISAVIALHLWKRQMLLSIAGGTVLYMVLVQLVF